MDVAVKAFVLIMGTCLLGVFLGALACKYDAKKGKQHMSKWEPSNAEMRQFFNDIHSISSSLKKLAATSEESTHTIQEFYERIVRENEKFEREVAEDEKKRQEEAAKAFDEGLQDGLNNNDYRDFVDDMLCIPIEPDPDERG